ncbi:MAG: sulfite exporter TauE/SafE family protein [Clostridiales bacterium]|nr:sulfite exporter TauE/SafE family protein [Clostridiales bacterium]
MAYLLSFLEGIITFISPCLLPMLPVYILYFAGGEADKGKEKRTLVNALGFVLGFTIVFVALGAFMAGLGSLLNEHQTAVNLITGGVVVVFGLNFMGVLQIGFLNGTHKLQKDIKQLGFFSAVLFGIVFSVGWTPCVGTFLGSALMMASQQGSVGKGIIMLLVYSMGLGIPFLISALLIDRLKGTFQFIKMHYQTINKICGALLVLVGIAMMTGWMSKILGMLA